MRAPEGSTATTNTPRVGVGVLFLNDTGEALLTLRKGTPEAECWSLTGGKVEFMETLEETAVRGTFEETGLHVKLVRRLCRLNWRPGSVRAEAV